MDSSTSRRNFIKTALAIPAALAVGPSVLCAGVDSTAAAGQPGSIPLPTRTLGRSGRKVSMICLGGAMDAYSPEYLELAWTMGIRYFDTAAIYLGGQSEQRLGAWLAKHPERRGEIFITTKDHPVQGPQQMVKMIDARLTALGTDYLDCFLMHGINPRDYGVQSLEWPKSDEFGKVVDQLKSSGKVKMIGFSWHEDYRYLMAAAQGRNIDAILLMYTPLFKKGDPFDQALDACHEAGVGLTAIKTMRHSRDIPARVPEFDKMGLDVHQALLHAVWSDERISAVCNSIDNVSQMESSTAAARSYKEPLHASHVETLRQIVLAGRRTLCPGCPACDASSATTALAFRDIARFVTYYEQDGNREARQMFHSLALVHRDFSSVDPAALRERCAFHTDYPEIMRRAKRYFA